MRSAVSLLPNLAKRAPDTLAAVQPVALSRRLVSEGLGTALLLATVVGSGIMGQRLADGNVAIALLANSLATAGALVVLILVFGPVSGAHFNPVVTLAMAIRKETRWADVPAYLMVQVVGAVLGVFVAHLMFELPLVSFSTHVRSGPAQVFSEFIATFGLLAVILGLMRRKSEVIPYAVACYIGAAYWFTSSTSFANPAVAIARCLTDTFAGIRPHDVLPFIVAEIVGAGVAVWVFSWLLRDKGLQSPASDREDS